MYTSMKESLVDPKHVYDPPQESPLDRIMSRKKLDKTETFFISMDFSGGVQRKSKSVSIVSSIIAYLKVAYYLGIVPYKPVFKQPEGCWKLEKHRVQQVLSVICFWIPFWVTWITKIPLILIAFMRGREGKITAFSYFWLLRLVMNYMKIFIYYWVFVGNRRTSSKLEQLLNMEVSWGPSRGEGGNFWKEESKKKAEQHAAKVQGRGQAYLTFVYLVIGILVAANFMFSYTAGQAITTPRKIFHRLIFDARLRFFLPFDKAFLSSNSTNYSRQEWALGGIETALRFYMHLGFIFTDTFFLGVLPVVMWTLVKNFEGFIFHISGVHQRNEASMRKLIQQTFEQVRAFSRCVNSIWSILNIVWVLDYSMRVMFQLNDSVSTRDALNLVTMAAAILLWGGALILSAEVFRKVARFRSWLLDKKNRERYFMNDNDAVNLLLKELANEPIGIGTEGLFRFNYAFVAELLIVIITLFLVSFEK